MNIVKKTAVITGGAQGIGRCLVQEFLKEEYNVAAADADREAGEELEKVHPKEVFYFSECDVSDELSVKQFIDAVLKKFHGIDVLINNAGIAVFKPFHQLSLKEWNHMGVNLTGQFLFAKYAEEALRKRKGRIINIASTRALMSEAGTEAYSASKGGVVGLTHALAISLGPDILVNCISPGWIEVSDWKKKRDLKTPLHSTEDRLQHPAGRVGAPYDIAKMALFLASQDAGFITGQNFVVDGGMTKKMIYV